jgi:WD40-like Beta Propeller Repeat
MRGASNWVHSRSRSRAVGVGGVVLSGLLLWTGGAPTAHALGPTAATRPTTVTVTRPSTRHVNVPLEPIHITRIALPKAMHEASTPIFTRDGRHLLFFSGQHLWRISTSGEHLACLTCGLAQLPPESASEQEGFATELPDRQRVFIGGASSQAILRCLPSVTRCRTRKIFPIDLSGARPPNNVIPPGGADAVPALDEDGASSPKISPDGHWIAFSDVTTDAVELMTIARLNPGKSDYTTSDPRVLNPAGPTSLSDTNTQAWSNSSALFEFKTFADGGKDATYAQVGGIAGYNPDVWKIDLHTGKRTRLTASPDWDEDDAPSPDGRSILIESDRTMHRVDMLGGLLPVRGFIDAPAIGVEASYFVAGPVDRQCDLQPWLFPASGDRHATLMGQPIQPYTGGDVHAANNVSGYPQWSPDGTRIALNTESFTTNRSADYLLVAHLTDRKPTKPKPIVSSRPGSWAPSPTSYHGAIGAIDTVVLHGSASGTATVSYDNAVGVVSGVDTVIYNNYSDNGRDVVNGTTSLVNPTILTGPIHLNSHLTMTGHNTGSSDIDLTYTGIDTGQVKVTGTASDSYDGTTISGVPPVPAHCPNSLPRKPVTKITARRVTRHGHDYVLARVTGRIAGDGANEATTEIAPVVDATVRIDSATARTNSHGVALIRVPSHLHGRHTVTMTAGDTLRTAQTSVTV